MVCIAFIDVPNREARPRLKSGWDPTQLATHSIPQQLEAALKRVFGEQRYTWEKAKSICTVGTS